MDTSSYDTAIAQLQGELARLRQEMQPKKISVLAALKEDLRQWYQATLEDIRTEQDATIAVMSEADIRDIKERVNYLLGSVELFVDERLGVPGLWWHTCEIAEHHPAHRPTDNLQASTADNLEFNYFRLHGSLLRPLDAPYRKLMGLIYGILQDHKLTYKTPWKADTFKREGSEWVYAIGISLNQTSAAAIKSYSAAVEDGVTIIKRLRQLNADRTAYIARRRWDSA